MKNNATAVFRNAVNSVIRANKIIPTITCLDECRARTFVLQYGTCDCCGKQCEIGLPVWYDDHPTRCLYSCSSFCTFALSETVYRKGVKYGFLKCNPLIGRVYKIERSDGTVHEATAILGKTHCIDFDKNRFNPEHLWFDFHFDLLRRIPADNNTIKWGRRGSTLKKLIELNGLDIDPNSPMTFTDFINL
jgi:hypothetical protein